ncbi:MAG: aldehyde dehydrogenase, partial [Rhodanobacteraceae bacterium]
MPKRSKLQSRYPYYLANKATQPNADLPVLDKYSGEIATRVALAGAKAIEHAIAAAAKAAAPMAA